MIIKCLNCMKYIYIVFFNTHIYIYIYRDFLIAFFCEHMSVKQFLVEPYHNKRLLCIKFLYSFTTIFNLHKFEIENVDNKNEYFVKYF